MHFTIFDPQDQLLGILDSQNSNGLQFYLATIGRTSLETEIAEWQGQGIPVMQETVEILDGRSQRVIGTRRIPYLSAESEWAIVSWMREHGFTLNAFREESLANMKKLLKLPLTPPEVRTLAQLLSITPVDKQAEWEEALKKALE